MAHSSGWILDVSVKQNRAIIWIKTIEGGVLRLTDVYQPNFYLLPTDENTSAHLFQILDQQPIVKNVWWEEKFTDLFGYTLGYTLAGSEESILKDFSEYVLAKDPDILISSNQHSRSSTILQYIFARIEAIELDLELGRDKTTGETNKSQGFISIASRFTTIWT